MRRIIVWLSPVMGLAIATMFSVSASAQSTATTTQTKNFEIISVAGNKVVVKGDAGHQELTVPSDFQLTVDGRPVTVADLKPGMKGTATITTTTTSTPVTVTEVRNGEVFRVTGNSIIVRSENGLRMFSEGDAARRGAAIYRDGRPVRFTDLRQGDRLTATIVTTKPPEVVTERQVAAAMTAPAAAAAVESPARATVAVGRATRAATPAPEATVAAARTLPKTATFMPLVGLLGASSLGLAFALSIGRRRW